MAICPFADTRWLIAPGVSDPPIKPRVAILHSDGGNVYNLGPYFDGPSGGIESHFHVAKDGHLFQYRDTEWEADANYLANPFAVSIETQGTGLEEWTREQIATILRLLKWLNEVHLIPLRLATAWNGNGIGWHIQFGSPGAWTPVAKICPGPKRIEQIKNTIIPALTGDWFDMATESDLRKIIREEVGKAQIVIDLGEAGPGDDKTITLSAAMRRLLDDEQKIRNALKNQSAKMTAAIMAHMPTSGDVSSAQVQAAVEAGIRKVLGALDEEA